MFCRIRVSYESSKVRRFGKKGVYFFKEKSMERDLYIGERSYVLLLHLSGGTGALPLVLKDQRPPPDNRRVARQFSLLQGRIQAGGGGGPWGSPKLHKEGKNVARGHANTPRFSTRTPPPFPKSCIRPCSCYIIRVVRAWRGCQ